MGKRALWVFVVTYDERLGLVEAGYCGLVVNDYAILLQFHIVFS